MDIVLFKTNPTSPNTTGLPCLVDHYDDSDETFARQVPRGRFLKKLGPPGPRERSHERAASSI